jgi:3,4-dihydroxy-2-butanone 4-phosphate synthase
MAMDPNPEDEQILTMLESYADENPLKPIAEKKHQDSSKPDQKTAFSVPDEDLKAAQKKLSAEEQEFYLKKLVEEERRRYDFLMIRNMKLKVKNSPT